MSSTNKTTHYDLSQYVGTDKPTYLSDYNSDMAKIDAALYEANTNASSAEANASTALTQVGQALSKANTNEGDISDLEGVTNLLNTNVTALNSFMNEIKDYNMTNGSLTFSPAPSNTSVISSQSVKYNQFNLNGLKLTSIYGSITLEDNPPTASTVYEYYRFNCPDLTNLLGSNRTLYNIGTAVVTNSSGTYNINISLTSSNGQTYTTLAYQKPTSYFTIYFQCCILG